MKDIFVARQPIFDADRKIVGYELLYRSNGQIQGADPGESSPTAMSSAVIVNSVLGMGLSSLTDGHKAFINFSEEMLLDGTAQLLDPDAVVIEVLEDIEPTEKVTAAIRSLSDVGFTIALDDFEYSDDKVCLLELADIVKLDVDALGEALESTLEKLKPFDVRLLAERIETFEEHERCTSLGFAMFQGFHYFRPETVVKQELASESIAVIRLMNTIKDSGTTERRIEDEFRADPNLTYKLLRIVNSAAIGGRGVQSIAHALRLLGRDMLYRWLSLLLMTMDSDGGDMRMELVKNALLRARMCEELGNHLRSARQRDIPGGGSLFLSGLFSQADQLLGVPVEELLAKVDVAREVRDALLERSGSGGVILSAVEAYADADWDEAESVIAKVDGTLDALSATYLDALTWAGDRVMQSEAA